MSSALIITFFVLGSLQPSVAEYASGELQDNYPSSKKEESTTGLYQFDSSDQTGQCTFGVICFGVGGYGLADAAKEAMFTLAAFLAVLGAGIAHRYACPKNRVLQKTARIVQPCQSATQRGARSCCEKMHSWVRSLYPKDGCVSATAKPPAPYAKAMTHRERAFTDASRPGPGRPPGGGAIRSSQSHLDAETDSIAAQVRKGNASSLPHVLDTTYRRAVMRTGHHDATALAEAAALHLVSALRACAARRHFREALVAYDHVAGRIGAGCGTTWSLLLYCATELKIFYRGKDFYRRLRKVAVPSGNDLTNMAKCFAQQGDVEGFRAILDDARDSGCVVDPMARNRAMAACAKYGHLGLVEELARNTWFGALDMVAYNMMMKSYAGAFDHQKCLALYRESQDVGLAPTDRTFGILLDSCAAALDYQRARDIFEDLLQTGLLNVVHYTTFLKCLVNAGQLVETKEVMSRIPRETGLVPDLITYSTVVKGFADKGRVSSALHLLEQAVEDGIQLDAVIFNVLLGGCCVEPMEPALVSSVLARLLRLGFQPSSSTLSILVKVYARSEAWDVALQTLEEAPIRFGVHAEPRVYAQLAQASASAGLAQVTVDTYEAMVKTFDFKGEALGDGMHNRLMRLCASMGEADRAEKIYKAAGVQPYEGHS